ncbi:hypothetical protein [Frigoriflavimonas asaccharolytica]|uniref:Uncharacterized protein n=1 Tax=Frigoriflavimonas asaccharolytica TaxID=2735899 RepID=A0A8J8G6V0_9FLAO|nr:hypothetical protein [Frigoriflavimonas asaccharolytica]NRS92334.1 hypothetical protein [Frigoriflavimonas asaccharolytica]
MLTFFIQKISANAAQPGIWNAGGTVFTMMYPKDAATFKKVQMQNEKIYMQLYPGFAVVKAWCRMKNTAKETLKFKMGYPVNGIYSGGNSNLNQVYLDSLSQFKIFSNRKECTLLKTKFSDENFERIQSFSDNWLVWEMFFLPEETKIVEGYFIVETNDGKITKGYNSDNYNAFIYLLESGSVWKQPIEKGEFYIQMMQGLKEKDIHGLSNGFQFKWNKNTTMAKGFKLNFSPSPKDNLIVTYGEREENFNFSNLIATPEKWYKLIDEFSRNVQVQNFNVEIKKKSPYEVSESIFGFLPTFLMIILIALPYMIVVAALLFVLIILRRRFKNKK